MNVTEKLSLKTKLGYGAGDIGGNLFFTVVGFWLLIYLTDVVGMSPVLAGLALWIGKAVDAFVDPMVGYLSDQTKSRWGRRRPWFLFSAIPMFIVFTLMFANPSYIIGHTIQNQTTLFIWASIFYTLICVVATLINIPYNALSAELTKDFNEKTTLNGYRMMFAVVGTLTGAGAAMPLVALHPDKSVGYIIMGAAFGFIMAVAALIPFFTVKEPKQTQKLEKQEILKSYIQAFKNRPFVLILLPWAFNTIGITIIQGALIYYFKYVLYNGDMMLLAMMIMLLTAMMFIPISVKVAEKIGKKQTYLLGGCILCVSVLIVFFLGHILPPKFIYAMMFFAGMGFSTHYVMPWAIIPDTIEYDYLKRGIRQEGVYFGLWTFMIKLGQAFALLFSGLILSAFAYNKPINPNDIVAQTPTAILGIRLLIGPFTVFFLIIANVILYFYPINKKKYEEIRAKIAIMEKEKGL